MLSYVSVGGHVVWFGDGLIIPLLVLARTRGGQRTDVPAPARRACSQSPMQEAQRPLRLLQGLARLLRALRRAGHRKGFDAEAPPVEDEGLTAAA